VCRPLGVEIYDVDAQLLQGWEPPKRAAYNGLHGLKIDQASWEK
jgi:hypothetical protein